MKHVWEKVLVLVLAAVAYGMIHGNQQRAAEARQHDAHLTEQREIAHSLGSKIAAQEKERQVQESHALMENYLAEHAKK